MMLSLTSIILSINQSVLLQATQPIKTTHTRQTGTERQTTQTETDFRWTGADFWMVAAVARDELAYVYIDVNQSLALFLGR